MTDLREAGFLGEVLCPFLHLRSLHLNGQTTLSANEVMVVTLSLTTAAVQGLPVSVDEYVNVSTVCHGLQGAIDGGQANGVSLFVQTVVQLLCRDEGASSLNEVVYRRSLLSRSVSTDPALRLHIPQHT